MSSSTITRNLRRLWKSVPLSRLKQGSTLSIRSNVPFTNVVVRSAWRDDGHVELKQVFRHRGASPTSDTNHTTARSEASHHLAESMEMSVTELAKKSTSLGRVEPHISVALEKQSPLSPSSSSQSDSSTSMLQGFDDINRMDNKDKPPIPYVGTVSVKKDIDRVILDDGTIHPVSDPEIKAQMTKDSDSSSDNSFRRTDYSDGIAHLQSISSSEHSVASSSSASSSLEETDGNDGLGTFLSLEVPEKLNLDCHLNQGGSIRICDKLEGDATLSTLHGDIHVKKLRGHEIHLKTQQGTVFASDLVEAQTVSIEASKRVRAMQLHGSSVDIKVLNATNNNAGEPNTIDGPTTRTQGGDGDGYMSGIDTDDEGSLIDVSALYVSGNGGAALLVDNAPNLQRRAVRVKTIHGPVRVETNRVPKPTEYNTILEPHEPYPIVELGGVNGNCEVEINNASTKTNQSPESATLTSTTAGGRERHSDHGGENDARRADHSSSSPSWKSCIVHVDSLAPDSVSLISAVEGDISITVDRKTEADLRLLSLSPNYKADAVARNATSLAEEEHSQPIIKNLLSTLAPNSTNDQTTTMVTTPPRISIETKAFAPNPTRAAATGSSGGMEYVEGWVENKSAEPDSRFERKNQGTGGKIRIDGAADQALDGFKKKENEGGEVKRDDVHDNNNESQILRPLFVAVGTGRIKLETLSWVGAIARRYGLDDSNRGLGRTAGRNGRL